jgi:uncharacterized protein YbaA (DUF1428 family)
LKPLNAPPQRASLVAAVTTVTPDRGLRSRAAALVPGLDRYVDDPQTPFFHPQDPDLAVSQIISRTCAEKNFADLAKLHAYFVDREEDAERRDAVRRCVASDHQGEVQAECASRRARGASRAAQLVARRSFAGSGDTRPIVELGHLRYVGSTLRRLRMYVDGFVVPVPKKNLDEYRKMAKLGAKLWMQYGALSYVETIADDVKKGKLTSFPQSVNLKPNEVVAFSFITYKSRRDRDRVNKLVMNDPRMKSFEKTMPFDGKRMIFGGFKAIVEK